MTKYAANAMLATKISFMNDIANLCELVGANVNEVRNGIGSDPRIGNRFIYPGVGYGGSCCPKDVKALIHTAEDYKYELRMLKAVDAINNDQKKILFHKIRKHFNDDLKNKVFCIWGLSFKPNTDDMREAPSIVLVNALHEAGAHLQAYDPVATKEAKQILNGKVDLKDDATAAAANADAIVLVTEWPEFRLPNWEAICKNMSEPVIFDGRNIYHKEDMEKRGFTYYGIGVGKK
jgi:UDPglucose 6-dehydrogenase